MPPKTTHAHFDVHPSVVFKLGEDLISDDVQALAELVKNSYDADAAWVAVRIDTAHAPDEHPTDVGFVVVEDNGDGMDLETLKRGWLTISNSLKGEMKSHGESTHKGRTPLGDKGLGRLGAQRLGNRITINTTPRGSDVEYEMSFDWRRFHDFDALSKVPVEIKTLSSSRKFGTKIVVSDLHEPERLADIPRLQMELSKVVSPYEPIEGFRLRASVNGDVIDLAELDTRVRDASVVRYELSFDGEALHISGKMRLAHLRPNAKADREQWKSLVEDDGGSRLLEYLRGLPESRDYRVRASRQRRWWAEFEQTINIDEIEPLLIDGTPAGPGPFEGEIDVFNLAAGSVDAVGVFDKAAELRRLVKDLHGIRVYRDGFNIRVADDWLRLGRQWSSGGSWYGLRPATTMGFLAISAAENQQLVETTDREGFKRTPHFENFFQLLEEFVRFTSRVQEFIGRGAASFRREAGEPDDDPDTPDELVVRLTETLSRAQSFSAPLARISVQLHTHATEADSILDKFAESKELDEGQLEMLAALNKLSRQATTAAELVDELSGFVDDLTEQQRVAGRLQSQFEALSDQLTLAYDTIAVGLTAEALSHEIANIAERLARRTTEIARHVKRSHPEDRRLTSFVEQVRGSVAGLRRQLAHLAPSLKYVRERRETLPMSTVLDEVLEYFEARWENKPIQLDVETLDDFSVSMNRGKLLQIFDNLLINSEYWLEQDQRLGRVDDGVVTITIDAPTVTIKDNGRGIDRQVESSLFQPFVTRKPRGEGRGLGLFILRQLLEAEGCEIDLGAVRNKGGRLYEFVVDFTGAQVDE